MKLIFKIGERASNLLSSPRWGRLLFKSQMNLFDSSNAHHEGDTRQGKMGTLIVKKNSSGHGGHWEYVNRQREEKQPTDKQPFEMSFKEWKNELQPEVVESVSRGGGFKVRSSKSRPSTKGEWIFYRTNTEGEALQEFYNKMIEERKSAISTNDEEEIEKEPLVNQLIRNDRKMVKAKPISLETAYQSLSKKKNCKVVIDSKNTDGGMFGNTDGRVEGILRTVNINSDGEMNLFVSGNEGEQIVKVPENQAIVTGNNRILIKYVDRDVLINMDNRAIEEEDENKTLIGDETAILPHLVADTVLARMMDVNSKETEEKFDEIVDKIVKLADQEYERTPKFKKKINGYNGKDELEIFFEQQIEKILKETTRTKEQVKTDNQLQIEIMQKAEIPEEEMVDYALSSVANGKILRTYINEVKSGEIDIDDAVNRVKHDYAKMKSGEKEGKFIDAGVDEDETEDGKGKEVHPNLIEYTTRELFKQKGAENAEKVFDKVSKMFDGQTNPFLGGKVNITKEQLKDALYTDKADTFIKQYEKNPDKAVNGLEPFALYFKIDQTILKEFIKKKSNLFESHTITKPKLVLNYKKAI